MEAIEPAALSAELRSWKSAGFPEGTGGGCHLLWGSPVAGESPFYQKPAWLANILAFWQVHPCLSYLFTGSYVGASSQAPRTDESGHAFHDLELAVKFLRSLPPGDHRSLINETLRHLHTDASGNTHRSEISFDKFWNPEWSGGAAGLIEFRAVESMPKTSWTCAVVGLWSCLGAALLKFGRPVRMKHHGPTLHDRFLLPSVMLEDLSEVLKFLKSQGWALPAQPFEEIWNWRFPKILSWGQGGLIVRRALEVWPLLSETPLEGGTTSRFVDASLRRIELSCTPQFAQAYLITINGREAPVTRSAAGRKVCGVRFRATRLRPSLHPGILPHTPLRLRILERATMRLKAEYILPSDSQPAELIKTPTRHHQYFESKPLRPIQPSGWTCDLRF